MKKLNSETVNALRRRMRHESPIIIDVECAGGFEFADHYTLDTRDGSRESGCREVADREECRRARVQCKVGACANSAIFHLFCCNLKRLHIWK